MESGIISKRKNFFRDENPERPLPGRNAFTIAIFNSNDPTHLFN